MGNTSLRGCCGIGERACEYVPHVSSRPVAAPDVDEDPEGQKRLPVPPAVAPAVEDPGPAEAAAREVTPAPGAEDAAPAQAAAPEPEPAPEPRTAAAEEPAAEAADVPDTGGSAPAEAPKDTSEGELPLESKPAQDAPKEAKPEQASGAGAAKIWTVVGGVDKGGLLVRRGCELSSAELPDRIATGAQVREVARAAERLKFQKVRGPGPEGGWITTRVKGRDMLAAA